MFGRTLSCVAAMVAVSGCAADYLNNYDTMTLASGDANNTNP
ncbi:MAG: calcium-binding protein, partial [Mesorhizobium sp.]